MKFTMEEKVARYLLHCIYLGQYVVNAARPSDRRLEEYDLLAEQIYKQYIAGTEEIPYEAVTDRQVADLRDRILDEVSKYLESFERDVLREKVSELL